MYREKCGFSNKVANISKAAKVKAPESVLTHLKKYVIHKTLLATESSNSRLGGKILMKLLCEETVTVHHWGTATRVFYTSPGTC